jgi:hypothetical protein
MSAPLETEVSRHISRKDTFCEAIQDGGAAERCFSLFGFVSLAVFCHFFGDDLEERGAPSDKILQKRGLFTFRFVILIGSFSVIMQHDPGVPVLKVA